MRLAAAALLAVSAVGCGGMGSSSAAPPTVVCGTTLSSSAAGAVVVDATGSHQGTIIDAETVGGVVIVRVTSGCDHGAHTSWSPPGAATLVKTANAKDGLPAAVVLRPTATSVDFTLTATLDGRQVAKAIARIRNGTP